MYQLHAAPRSINRDDAGQAARTSKCKYTHSIEEAREGGRERECRAERDGVEDRASVSLVSGETENEFL